MVVNAIIGQDAIEGLITMASAIVDKFTPAELTSVVMALANLDTHTPQSLMEKLADTSERQLKYLSPPELVNLAWGFSRLGHHNESLFNKLGLEAVRAV